MRSAMAKRKTNEEYILELQQKLPHIIPKEQYQGNRVSILHHCSIHNVDWMVSPFNLLQHGNGCKFCQEEAHRAHCDERKKSNEQFVKEVFDLGTGIKPLDKYDGLRTKIRFQCANGHIWSSTPHDILYGYGCPYCSGNKVLRGFNDLWTTHPGVASMLKDKDIGYEISYGTHRVLDFVCPQCGYVKQMSPKQIISYGFGCNMCSVGIKYPNRFLINMLKQLNIIGFIPEWTPEWVRPYRYDAYFCYNDIEYVVEMDGGIGHGCYDYHRTGIDYNSIKRDEIKEKLAVEHNIKVIRVDCKYTDMKIRYQYVKNSVLNSELNNIFDLSKIDFDKCNKEANSSLSIYAAKEYDSGKSIRQISDEICVSYDTVYKWLKRLASEGLCSYVPVIGRTMKYNLKHKTEI